MILNKKEREMLVEILRSANGASVNEVPFVLNAEELALLDRLNSTEPEQQIQCKCQCNCNKVDKWNYLCR